MKLFPYYRWPLLREAAFVLWPLLKFRLEAEKALLRALAEENPRTVLEIGCGQGNLSRKLALLLPEAQITSLDNEPRMIEAAKRRASPPNLTLSVGDFYDTPLKAEAVVLFHVFVLFWPYERSLRRLWELTERVALLTLTAPSLFTRAHRVVHKALTGLDVWPVEPKRFAELAEEAGFKASWQPIHPLERSYLVKLRRN